MMKDKQTQQAERTARQQAINAKFVDPYWSKNVDIPLMEMSMMMPISQTPIVLLPEMRYVSLMRMVLEIFPKVGKMMIVDSANTRFEQFRNIFTETGPSLYYSAQNLNALNYTDDVFNNVISEISLPTLASFETILPEYSRVLRKDGRMVLGVPLVGTFPAFFDILNESLLKLSPRDAKPLEIQKKMTVEHVKSVLERSKLHLDGCDVTTFELKFQTIEQLLFSTFVETCFLSYCITFPLEYADTRQLLMLTLRAFHHYFQGEEITFPVKMGLFAATKN